MPSSYTSLFSVPLSGVFLYYPEGRTRTETALVHVAAYERSEAYCGDDQGLPGSSEDLP